MSKNSYLVTFLTAYRNIGVWGDFNIYFQLFTRVHKSNLANISKMQYTHDLIKSNGYTVDSIAGCWTRRRWKASISPWIFRGYRTYRTISTTKEISVRIN